MEIKLRAETIFLKHTLFYHSFASHSLAAPVAKQPLSQMWTLYSIRENLYANCRISKYQIRFIALMNQQHIYICMTTTWIQIDFARTKENEHETIEISHFSAENLEITSHFAIQSHIEYQ